MDTFNCTICPAKFKTLKGLENHKCRWICAVCAKKLTTEKGFLKHKANHGKISTNKANAEQLRIDRQNQQIEKYNRLSAEIIEKGLFNPKYKVGDTVFVSTYHVTKPTHEWRYTRMVHVRYEEERRYYSLKTTIEDTRMSSNSYSLELALMSNAQVSVYYKVGNDQRLFTDADFFESLILAEKDASLKSIEYKKQCDFASMCR